MFKGISKRLRRKSSSIATESPRPLTAEETALLRWMIEHGVDEAKEFFPQIQAIRATRGCKCGCPSICLHVDENAGPVAFCEQKIISDQIGRTAKGELVGVMLFQENGKLSELETYSVDGLINDAANNY